MNTELFIAKKIIKSGGEKSFSRPIVKISIAGIALGIIVMILTISISKGFKGEIRNRISIFGSHIKVINIGSYNSWENSPIIKDEDLILKLSDIKGISSINIFANKTGIIKSSEDIQGVILKGVDLNYNWENIENLIISGKIPELNDSVKSSEILISSQLSNILKLKPGDKVLAYFIQEVPRQRLFIISGVYENSLDDFNNLLFCDIRHIQKLNNWEKDQIGGYEILINDFDKIEELGEIISEEVGYNFSDDGSYLIVETIKQKYSHWFNWFNVFDTNTWVILFLMITIASFNMISGLLILILERTNMIGILKSMGAQNWNIRKIFLYNSIFIIGKGMFWGNLIGLGFYFLQKQFGIITLDPQSYYISVMPVDLNIYQWLALNTGTFILTLSSLIIPSYIIARFDPAKAIRFE